MGSAETFQFPGTRFRRGLMQSRQLLLRAGPDQTVKHGIGERNSLRFAPPEALHIGRITSQRRNLRPGLPDLPVETDLLKMKSPDIQKEDQQRQQGSRAKTASVPETDQRTGKQKASGQRRIPDRTGIYRQHSEQSEVEEREQNTANRTKERGGTPFLPEQIHFVHSQELLSRYPDLDAKGRERAIAKELGAVFLIGIGGKLSNGKRHDVRAPDYDDWSTEVSEGFAGLNGDILVWNPVLEDAFEISSMGIRVDAEALKRQLAVTGDEDRLQLEWHQALLRGEMPQTIGGGIGQSRLTMLLLQLDHIGQVQCGVWPAQVRESVSALL